jgi:hypothetical protein
MNETPDPVEKPAAAATRRPRRPRVRVGAIIALAIAAGVVAWVVLDRTGHLSSSSSSSSSTAGSPAGPVQSTDRVGHLGPVALSPAELRSLARQLHQPIYWAASKRGYTYELTRTTDGKVYVRYLPAGVKVGDPGATFLIIATYPFPGALKALRDVAHGNGVKLPGGGFALPDDTYPKSVHLAYPGVAYQVEVYDPSPRLARSVALSGVVRPVG